jgi:hypothetical protein
MTKKEMPFVEVSLAQIKEECERRLKKTYDYILEEHAAARQELAAAAAEPDEWKAILAVGNALEWGHDLAVLSMKAEKAYWAMYHSKKKNDIIALSVTLRAELRRDLLNNAFRPSSTGAFHNAYEIAKGEAAKWMYREIDHELSILEEEAKVEEKDLDLKASVLAALTEDSSV